MMRPCHALLGTERRLVKFPTGRHGRNAAQGDPLDGEGIAVRKNDPTFCADRTLSSTTTSGSLGIAANSSTEGRCNSSFVIFRMTDS